MPQTAILKPNTKASYFPALTGVRAVAAYMVVFYHLHPLKTILPSGRTGEVLTGLMQQGWVGVSVFFVLSGFLITNRYAANLVVSVSWMRRYLQNRFARIYPIYFLLSTISFLILQYWPFASASLWNDYSWKDKAAILLANFTLLRAFFENIAATGLPTAWSLTVEETFYLSVPFLLIGLRGNWKRLLAYPALLMGIGLVLVKISAGAPYGFMGSVRHMMVYTFFGRCIEFLLGMALALWMGRHPKRESTTSLVTWIGIAGFGLCLVGLAAADHYLPPVTLSRRLVIFGLGMISLPVTVTAIFWGLIQELTWIRRVLSTKVFDLLGKSSYVLYLLHVGPIDDLFSHYVTHNPWGRVVSYTLLSIVLYKTVEHPLHTKLRAKQIVPA